MKVKSLLFTVLAIFVYQIASAASLSIYSSASGVFVLQGSGFTNAAGVDVTIGYDPATLANPQVTMGNLFPSGAFMVPNTAVPGMVRLAIVHTQPVSGSGVIATLSFSPQGGSAGRITSLSGTLVTLEGGSTPLTGQISNPVDSLPQAPQETPKETTRETTKETASTETKSTAAPTGATWLGGVTMPGDGDKPREKVETGTTGAPPLEQDVRTEAPRAEPGPDLSPQEPQAEPVSPKPEPPAVQKPDEPKRLISPQGVLARFRDFQGEKTPEAFMALFEMKGEGWFRQEPPIALSDGKTPVRVYLNLGNGGKQAPNFAVQGARLVSMKKNDGNWIIEVIPAEKGVDVALKVLQSGMNVEVPLTVAPPMDVNIDLSGDRLTEAHFKLFIRERGTPQAPRFDLNRDKVRNYIDDYIFTANYLLQLQRTIPAKPPQKKP